MSAASAEGSGRVRLPPLAPERAAALLCPPWLPAAAAAEVQLAPTAAAGLVPVLLAAPVGGHRLLLARALHALAGRGGPLVAVNGPCPVLGDLPPDATLYLDVGALTAEGRLLVEALLDDATAWVIAGLEPGVALDGPLAWRLGAIAISVPPLRERREDVPALAAAIVATLARHAGAEPAPISDEALAALAAQPWPGDVGQLEATLARSLLLAGEEPLDVQHLALEPAPASPAIEAPAAADAPKAEASTGSPQVEFLLAELAHELRNPMVTVKTYADHLPTLLEDAELRDRFKLLADDAIKRMDGLLENILDFARMGPPRRQAVDLRALLDRVLADVQPGLGERTVRLNRPPPTETACAGDPQQLEYALRNLLAGVVREVPAREHLSLDASANGVVTLRFAAGGGAAERLRRLTAPSERPNLSDPTLLPLSFTLARAVLERNGGHLAVVPEGGGGTAVVVRLPTLASDSR